MSKEDAKSQASVQVRSIPTRPSPIRRSELSQSPSRASVTARLATPVYGSSASSQLPAARPQYGESPQQPLSLSGAANSSYGPGTSSLSQALREQGAQSARRYSQVRHKEAPIDIAARNESPDRRAGDEYFSFTPNSYNARSGRSPRKTDEIEVLRRHLVGPSQGGSESTSPGPRSLAVGSPKITSGPTEDGEFSSLQLQGGDTTRHIYRYAERREREHAEEQERGNGRLRRSMSMTLPAAEDDEEGIKNIQVPGGFRRDHIRRTAGSPAPSSTRRPQYGTVQHAYTESPRPAPQFVASNFIEFLTLYGHFAGEDLGDDDEDLDSDDYFSPEAYEEALPHADDGREDDGWGEDSALLTPGKKKRRRKAREAAKGTPFGAAMLLLKSFVGTGVLFLPRAFLNGGMAFSNVMLFFIAAISYYCFILLVSTRLKIHASFGDMGAQIYGKHFRNLINFSLVISQLGFSSAYMVFVSENIQAFLLAITDCHTFFDVRFIILIQMFVYFPVSLYRNINKIQKMALVADLFICIGLVYLYYYNIKTIVERPGVADIQQFNSKTWTLLIGTAIFTFEGIGLIIPIQSSMREPDKFPRVLAIVMAIITVIFISAGALSYAAYGSSTQTVILLNLPQADKMVNTVQFLYSLAILMSTPLQIFPAIEITSQQLFSKTGKHNPRIKWQKNLFRFFMVVVATCIAWVGADDLDKFVSLVGSFACIPLVYIYPPLMHNRVVATRNWQKIVNWLLIVFGFGMMVYTTSLTVVHWIGGEVVKSPGYCDRAHH